MTTPDKLWMVDVGPERGTVYFELHEARFWANLPINPLPIVEYTPKDPKKQEERVVRQAIDQWLAEDPDSRRMQAKMVPGGVQLTLTDLLAGAVYCGKPDRDLFKKIFPLFEMPES